MEQLDAQPEEIFEINDFTVVTEYERFIVQLESIVHDWGIRGRRPSSESHFDAVIFFKYPALSECLEFKATVNNGQVQGEGILSDFLPLGECSTIKKGRSC